MICDLRFTIYALVDRGAGFSPLQYSDFKSALDMRCGSVFWSVKRRERRVPMFVEGRLS